MIPPRTILAPVDFSDASRASLQCAARLAAQWTATLHVMHAIDPLLAAAASAQQVDLEGETRAELRAFLEAAAPDGARRLSTTPSAAAPRRRSATWPTRSAPI